MEKYFNDAIVGNKNITASFTKKGELIRLFYPTSDYKQFVDFFHAGIKINDSSMVYMHNDVNNLYKQYYTEDTNILNTEIYNTYFNLKTIQTDFVPIKENVLVRRYKFMNQGHIDLDVNLLIHSKLLTDENNQVSGYFKHNALLQYSHDYTMTIVSNNKIENSQINNNEANILEGVIGDKDYIGMSADSSISYNIGKLKPKEEKTIDIFVFIEENKGKPSIVELERIKKLDIAKNLEETKKYWKKFVKDHNTIKLDVTSPYRKRIDTIYKRTILTYPLLTNATTGGISAAIEIDENRTKCGRYSYCWPRDAIFITEAMDILNMKKETEKFYKTFCKNTQNKDGMWEQRFYTDGSLAPCWGYQIDETASVVYGVYSHFLKTREVKFLKDNLKMCEKAVHYLKRYVENILIGNPEQYLSYDIWEENEGIHTYSLAAIFASFNAMINIYESVKEEYKENRLKLEAIQKENRELDIYLREIKEYIIKNLYSNEKKSFIRNKDGKIDISLLGLSVPFNLFVPTEKKIENTIEKMNLTLRTYTGGYLRYENDNYVGGNPWVISNLWLANYYIEAGKTKEAKECFKFVVNSSTEHGFLGEQVNNQTMEPAWVIGLRMVTCIICNCIRKVV